MRGSALNYYGISGYFLGSPMLKSGIVNVIGGSAPPLNNCFRNKTNYYPTIPRYYHP